MERKGTGKRSVRGQAAGAPPDAHPVRIGIGGWVFAPWRESFYPPGMRPDEWLPYASRQLTSIEVNGTYYRTQTPETFRSWREATPDGFVFALKGPRAATQPRDAERATAAIERFLASGVTELGPKLGPIAWQFPSGRKFAHDELGAFLTALPAERDGVRLRHAIEAEHDSFRAPDCVALLGRHGVAHVLIGHGDDVEPAETADFVYARLKGTIETEPAGFSEGELAAWARRIGDWHVRRDCYVYVIAGAKARNPAAARALIGRLGDLAGIAPA